MAIVALLLLVGGVCFWYDVVRGLVGRAMEARRAAQPVRRPENIGEEW